MIAAEQVTLDVLLELIPGGVGALEDADDLTLLVDEDGGRGDDPTAE